MKGYSPEERKAIVDEVCDFLARGDRSLRRILDEEKHLVPSETLYKWMRQDEEIAGKIARARDAGIDQNVEEIVEIADNSTNDVYIDYDKDGNPVAKIDGDAILRAKLRIYAREKKAQMMKPKTYGPKIDVTSGGEKLPEPATPILVDNRIQSLVQIALSRREQEEQLDEETKRLME